MTITPSSFICFGLLSLAATLCLAAVASAADDDQDSCGLWLGSSNVKASEEHGFGLGLYTGKAIKKGDSLSSQILLPIFDMTFPHHPPLREYVWGGGDFKPLTLEVLKSMHIFSPGASSISPCTSVNYNFKSIDMLEFDRDGVQRHKDPTTGSFSYYSITQFQAVRDIAPGEELVVQCSDDDYDADKYSNYRVDTSKSICMDDKLEERLESTIKNVGRGVYAKKDLTKDSLVLSSPAVPITRKLLDIKSIDPTGTQLLLNYCFGHPESDLLWLPYGPLVNAINHADDPSKVNVKVIWHKDPLVSNQELERRQQYHHPELLDLTAQHVADTHGKGLMMDFVATQNIKAGDELFLDYGTSWREAWNKHVAQYSKLASELDPNYIPAVEFDHLQQEEPIRTITEQHHQPYPPNVMTACRFQQDWIDDEFAEDYDMIQYQSWNTQKHHHRCLLPCLVLERLDESGNETHYTAKLVDHHHSNKGISWDCHIFKRFEYIYTDIPREGLEFIESTYTSDDFLPLAFRHFMEVSDGMYPTHWMRQRVRRRSGGDNDHAAERDEEQQKFKRKSPEPVIAEEVIEWKLMASPRNDL